MDRVVAAAAGMAGTLYIMAAAAAWTRILFSMPAETLGRSVMFDRAVAWSALAVLFGIVVAVKLTDLEWDDPGIDVIRTMASLAIFLAGLASVRAVTQSRFGNRVLAAFASVSIAVGLLILLG